MAFNVAQSFHRTGPIPIDDSQVLTKAEMLAYADGDMPDVYFAVCKDDGNLYIYNKANTADPETGKFKILQNGSSDDVLTTDALDNRTLTPSGWGVAKTGIVRINLPGNEGVAVTVDLTDLNFASVDDYNSAIAVSGGNGAWGRALTYCNKVSATQLHIGAYKAESGASYVDVSYVVVAKGYGGTHFADGTGLPVGGTAEQILSKVNDEDGIVHWVDDEGRNLVKFDRKYGLIPVSFPIKQWVAEFDSQGYAYLPLGGCITSVETFVSGVANTFDVYLTYYGTSYKASRADSRSKVMLEGTGSYPYWSPYAQIVDGKLRVRKSMQKDALYEGELSYLRFVAREGYNLGTSDGTVPYDIRNVTGMVLDDLKVTGNAVPTDWGIATIAKTSISIPSVLSATQTIDISGFGFESGNDYTVSCDIYNGAGDWAKVIMNVGSKSATSFMLIAKAFESNTTRVDVEYTIFAKGYGNNTMQEGGSSLPSGGAKGDIIVKKSSADGDVEWTPLDVSEWGVARTGVATVTFNNSKWSSSATVDVSDLGFSSGADYDVVAQPTTGGTATPWGNSIAFVNADKGASSFSVSSVTMEESLSGTVNVKYTIFAKGHGTTIGGSGGSVDAYTKAETDSLLAEKATGYFERTDYPIILDTVGQPYYALARDVFKIEVENHKPYTYEFTSSDVFNLTTRYNETVGKTFTAVNEDNETIWITMKGALPDNVQYVVGSTNPVVDLANAAVTLTKTTFIQQIDDMLIPRTSGEVFVFDVDSDQFTEDPENTGGKHYGMTIDSPTFDEIMDNLVAGKIVFVRMSFNGGNSYDFYQLSRESQQGIRGKAFDLEFPQGHIWFYDIYIKKRGLGTNTTTYFGVFSDKVVDGSDSSTVSAESDIFRISVDYSVAVDTSETLYGQTLDPDEPKSHSASGTLTGDHTYAKIVEALNAGKNPVVMLTNFWAGATSTGITIPMQHYVPTTGDPMFIGYYGFKRTVSNASYSTEPVILTVKIYESEGTTKVDISDNSFPNLFERVKALENAAPTTSVKQIDVDALLSDTSENPVQNKVVTSAITTVRQALQNVENALNDGKSSLNVATIPGGGGGDEISVTFSQGTDSVNVNYYKETELPDSLNFNVCSDYFRIPTTKYVDGSVGDLTTLTTTNKSSAVEAINEIDFAVKGLGEPFRVKQWGSNKLNVEIPYCTEDIANGDIPKMVYTIDNVEGADYQIVGMLAYEVFDAESGGNRINCFPVCQFTGNGQKELSVRWACMGTTRKTAKRINAWVLLKHR